MNSAKRMVIIPNRITIDKLTMFEYAELITTRIRDIGRGSAVFIDPEELVIPVDEYDSKLSKENKEIVLDNDKFHIVEDSTYGIAKIELNKGRSPYLLVRVIKERDDIVYAEIVNPNNCIKPI